MDASDPIPTKVDKYIRLEVQRPLSKTEIKSFVKTVEQYGPQNNLSSVTINDSDGNATEVRLVHQKFRDGRERYELPLKRDLMEKEIVEIVDAWDAYYPEGDFVIETSAEQVEERQNFMHDAIIVEDDRFDQLCEALAQAQHESWMTERVDEGWRFGERMSQKEKTHPMLRPWHELPDKYRKIDRTTPQMFIEELNRLGYYIVDAEQFEGFAREGNRGDLLEQLSDTG